MFSERVISFPPRPYVPPALVVMVGFVLLLNLCLYGYVHIALIDAYLDAPVQELRSTAISSLEFEITDDYSSTETGYLVLAKTRLVSGQEATVWLQSSEAFELGQHICCIGRFVENDSSDWGVSNRARGIAGKVQAVRTVQVREPEGSFALLIRMRRSVLECIAPSLSEERALIAGVIAGYRANIKERKIDDVFSKTGLSHLIAVSGSHLIIVAGILDSTLLGLNISSRKRSLICCLVAGIYVLFCASPASAVRSWVMLCALHFGRLVGRRAHSLSSVGLVGILMCLFEPTCAANLGFQLSVLSVCSLSLFSAYIEYVMKLIYPSSLLLKLSKIFYCLFEDNLEHRLSRAQCGRVRRIYYKSQKVFSRLHTSIVQVFSASLSCQFATSCICAYTFGEISLIAPFANIVVAPLFTPLISISLVGCLLGAIAPFGNSCIVLASCISSAILFLVKTLAAIPFASIPVYLPAWAQLLPLVAAVILLIAWPKPTANGAFLGLAGLVFAFATWFLVFVYFAPAQIVVLDVGQGDAILLKQGLHALLIDTGPGEVVCEALARNNVFFLDGIVLTHLHDDHIGGLESMAGKISATEVYVAEGVSSAITPELEVEIQDVSGSFAKEVCAGESLSVGGFTLTCLWPQTTTDGSENEDSLCFYVSYANDSVYLSALLTGDAESDVLAQLVGIVGDIDVLKIGHHGSEVSITSDEAAALKAELAIASAGKDNSYGHPTQTCLETLQTAGTTTECTIDHGDIAVLPTAEGIVVRYQR